MNLPVYATSGAETGREVEFDDAVFGLEPNDHVIWLDVRSIQAAQRQGTHKTKERSEVSRSRRKLYRQKGTGNARAGDAKSPLRKGGGTIFGPRPHKYTVGINKKTKRLARRSAIAHKLRGGLVRVVEDFSMPEPKTRDFVRILRDAELEGTTVLVLTNGNDDVVYRSARNLPGVAVMDAAQASTVDLLRAKTLVFQEGAVQRLTEVLTPSRKPTALSAPSGDGSAQPIVEPVAAEPAPEAVLVETAVPTAAEGEPVAPAEPVIDAPDDAPAEEPVAPAEPVIDAPDDGAEADAQTDTDEKAA